MRLHQGKTVPSIEQIKDVKMTQYESEKVGEYESRIYKSNKYFGEFYETKWNIEVEVFVSESERNMRGIGKKDVPLSKLLKYKNAIIRLYLYSLFPGKYLPLPFDYILVQDEKLERLFS